MRPCLRPVGQDAATRPESANVPIGTMPMPATRPPTSVLRCPLLLAAAIAASAAFAAPPAPVPARTMGEILAASAPSDWRALDPHDTLYLDLDAGRVVIELAPRFAPAHVANIRTLAREGYWDGLTIYRSQDNFVVQFGDPEEDPAARRPLGSALEKLPAEFTTSASQLPFTRLPDGDGWAPQVGFSDGFPAAHDPETAQAWLAHCYGALGAGRGMAADSSNGTELYVVTGQSPRQLDRNITLVGRVVKGIELLSTLPRGGGPLGFYEDQAQRTTIRSIRLASTVPEAEREGLEVLRTDAPLFAELVESRRNRRDEWYKRPAGHIDLCNVPQPVRERSEAAD
jgi:peptidylprolyl isomerase